MHTEKAYWLPSHVRACSTATGTVLLDLQRNRYFGVGRNETLALRSLAGNWQSLAAAPATFASDAEPLPVQEAVSIADKLVQAGLLSNNAPEPAAFTTMEVDLQSLLTSVGHELDLLARGIGERDERTDTISVGDYGSRSLQRSVRRVPVMPPERG